MKVIAMPPELRKDQQLKSSNAFQLWKEQKEERKAGSRSLFSGKIIRLFHEINRSNIVSLNR